ncbi:hypothetical protein O181_097867 [Austropuccinia psidii MF-1]|uniref:Uncharacterized protein n=1 Tax=Austropuccinia psidii MF-1 TaxID=1389203 RepID=A0A9Q3JA30_9BASI|nr:hypothetical protein [Austropuccinia psidii MF-1]
MVHEHSVPIAPKISMLKEFSNRFKSAEEIKNMAESDTSVPLIPQSEVLTLKGVQPGRKKVGRGIVYIKEFFILYIQVLLSKLGIRQWAPNLEEASDTLYNEACRISAIQSFRQVAIGGAYEHMNINLRYLNDIKLLHDTYNHYVHYYMAQRFKKEMKEAGKHRKDQEKGAIQLSRKRLRDIRYKFGVANNFPKRYLKVLSKRDAHSDDEYITKNTYKIKKLVFRSDNANKFMRRVDEEIEKAERIQGKRSRRRIRIEADPPELSPYSQPPKGLPIDFYDSKWFNDCPIGEKTVLADSFKVAFLPNASQSIRGIQHPDERLSDRKFTEKYWEKCTASYDLSHEISKEDDGSESDDDESESIASYSESDEEIAEDNNEEESNQSEFNRVLDFDTPMAHAEDPSQFVVGGSSFLSGDEWKRDL